MLTVFLIGVAAYVASKTAENLRDFVRRGLVVGGVIIALAGPFVAGYISSIQPPEELREVPFVSAGISNLGPTGYTDGKVFYQGSQTIKTMLLPGAPMKYTESEPPEGYCAHCQIICDTMYCVDCGDPLYPMCPNCGSRCETTHCGSCGTHVREDSYEE